MILFSSIKLEKALAEKKLTDWQKAKYIIIPWVVLAPFSATVVFVSPRFGERPPGIHFLIQLFFTISSMVITYFGIKFCFKVNKTIDGHNFIERLCILVLPVAFKLYLIFLPLTLIITGIIYAIDKHHLHLLPKFSLIFAPLMAIFTLIYYSLLVRSFRRFGSLLNKTSS